ncbi:MAG: MogA/MoaB family molybdenum cofactor biosynthesis protein, partial [Desulforhopalus sp.]
MKSELPRSYSFAVLTMSDKGSQGEREDTSGAYLKQKLTEEGYLLQSYSIIADQKQLIIENLIELVDNKKISLIVTTGGTGVSPSDITPEAMSEVLEREIPGMAVAMRGASLKKTSRAMLARGKGGLRKE